MQNPPIAYLIGGPHDLMKLAVEPVDNTKPPNTLYLTFPADPHAPWDGLRRARYERWQQMRFGYIYLYAGDEEA